MFSPRLLGVVGSTILVMVTVGTALMRWVVDASTARGLAGIVCSSLPEMTSAHRIYERLGFRRAPARDWSPVPGVDLIAFALRL